MDKNPRPNFAFSAFSEVRFGELLLRRAAVLPFLPTALALEPVFVLLGLLPFVHTRQRDRDGGRDRYA
jgi:hypothetical protein